MTNFGKFADIGQHSIDLLYSTDDEQQLYNNVYPFTNHNENEMFNYWWIAHLVDIRVDAYKRTGNEAYLDSAQKIYHHNKKRNNNSLKHIYYDDMLWNALAATRLFNETHKPEYLCDAQSVCDDIMYTAWNDTMGGGFAWTRKDLFYKNTPVNAPFMILALRLYQLSHDQQYLEISYKTLDWMQSVLVDSDTQYVQDGINRNEDGKIDSQWEFSYNQGVYIGAMIEFYHVTHDIQYLEKATQCAHTAIKILGKKGVIDDQGDGGDIGLFKGILYRYMALLYKETHDNILINFITSSVEILINHAVLGDQLLAPRDWTLTAVNTKILLSDEISAVMALESASLLAETTVL